jgi:hypothetical protein
LDTNLALYRTARRAQLDSKLRNQFIKVKFAIAKLRKKIGVTEATEAAKREIAV